MTMSDEVEAYVDSARRLELLALDLAQTNIGEIAATRALIEAAGGDVRVMRRAHRHGELAVSDQWPAEPTLIRAYDYLSAGRRELEAEQSRSEMAYDVVDEAGMESFPASDPPSFWGR